MRFFKILSLHLQGIIEHRLRSFVWFLIALFNPLFLLLFWKGALTHGKTLGTGWNLSDLASYYFLLVIAGSMLTSHIEDTVADIDIKQGSLITHLLRPYPYYWIRFIGELPFRFLQGLYGIITFIIFAFFFPSFIHLTTNPLYIFAGIIMCILAYSLSQTFKMILGFSAFWLTEIRGIMNVVDLVTVVCAGFVLPIVFLPNWLKTISEILPFSYMIYYPVLAFQGKLTSIEYIKVLGIQIIWLILFAIIYKLMWKAGLKKFTGVGQ